LRKLRISVAVSILVVFLVSTFSFAAAKTIVLSDSKIIINGKIVKSVNKPLSINKSLYLQLDETLAGIGIPNDKKHITWNAAKKTETIINGKQRIVIIVGNKNVIVAKSQVSLEIAPIYSNKKVYVPISLIEKVFDKKVIWDEVSKSVLIKGNADFNKVKDIVRKVSTAMNNVSKAKFSMYIKTAPIGDSKYLGMGINAKGEVDKLNKVMHTLMNSEISDMKVNVDQYYKSNIRYYCSPYLTANAWWQITLSDDEYNKEFEYNSSLQSFRYSDILSAGLLESKDSNSDEILLKGDTYLYSFIEGALKNTTSEDFYSIPQDKFDKFNLEVTLDKNTYLVKKIVMNTSLSKQESGLANAMNISIIWTYSDYDGSFEVKIPEDVLNSSKE